MNYASCHKYVFDHFPSSHDTKHSWPWRASTHQHSTWKSQVTTSPSTPLCLAVYIFLGQQSRTNQNNFWKKKQERSGNIWEHTKVYMGRRMIWLSMHDQVHYLVARAELFASCPQQHEAHQEEGSWVHANRVWDINLCLLLINAPRPPAAPPREDN